MKDISYFLDEEDDYNNNKSTKKQVNEETLIDSTPTYDSLDFLCSRPFHVFYENIEYGRKISHGYNLSDAELTMLGMFLMQYSRLFRDDYYKPPIPNLVNCMFETLNQAISKAPQNNCSTLYRFCNDYDKADFKVGETTTFPFNLTCTEDKWNISDKNIYIINTLPQHKTRARALYRMYRQNKREKQINFLRNSTFIITHIDRTKDKKHHIFYMNEILNLNHN